MGISHKCIQTITYVQVSFLLLGQMTTIHLLQLYHTFLPQSIRNFLPVQLLTNPAFPVLHSDTLVSYPTLSAGRHFIHYLPRSGRDWAHNCCTVGGVNPIRQHITDSLIKYYHEVMHNALVKVHQSMQMENRYERFKGGCR